MKIKFIFSVLFLFFLGVKSITAQVVTISPYNCTRISAKYVGPNGCLNCREYECGLFMDPSMKLQQKTSNGSWVTINVKPGTHHDFQLVSGNRYRVVAVVPQKILIGSGPVCGQSQCNYNDAYYCLGTYTYTYSDEFTAGQPSADFDIIDVYGEPGNGWFCWHDPVIMDGGDSENEQGYQINMWDGNGNWVGTNWIQGEVGYVDLLDVWTANHPGWWLWPGNYTVRLAVYNHCDSYEFIEDTFKVVETANSFCRKGNLSPNLSYTVYPNPAAYELNFTGLDDISGDINYTITSMMGRVVKQGRLSPDWEALSIEDLPGGMYVITLMTEDQMASQRFNKLSERP